MLVCPVSGIGKKELGDSQNKKISSASRQNKKKKREKNGPDPLIWAFLLKSSIVKNHVAFNLLVVKGHALARVQTLKGNAHIFHFFSNGICPKGIAILLVNFGQPRWGP